MPTPMRTLQVAVTAAALLLAQAPAASAQSPAPAPTTAPAPPAPPATEPPLPPPPTTDSTRAPSSELPTEPQPLPPWTPGAQPEQPPVGQPGPTPPETPPPGDQPPTEPPPSDVAGPPPGPTPPPEAPVDLGKANRMRTAGVGTMIAGGAIALVGFGLSMGFTLRGTKYEKDLIGVEGAYQIADCSRTDSSECDALTAERADTRQGVIDSDKFTRISGGILAGGLLVVAAGGIVYMLAKKRLDRAGSSARLRVSPTFGGFSLSGRF